jgi:hypothetical protein
MVLFMNVLIKPRHVKGAMDPEKAEVIDIGQE